MKTLTVIFAFTNALLAVFFLFMGLYGNAAFNGAIAIYCAWAARRV